MEAVKAAIDLALRLGRLAAEAMSVAFGAANGDLSADQVDAELARIRRDAAEDKAADWDVVRS